MKRNIHPESSSGNMLIGSKSHVFIRETRHLIKCVSEVTEVS